MNSFFRLLPLLSLPLLLPLHGCGLFADTPAQPQTPPGPVEAYMISANPGDSTTLEDPGFGKNVRVTLDNGFTSAKGEECKRPPCFPVRKKPRLWLFAGTARGSGGWRRVSGARASTHSDVWPPFACRAVSENDCDSGPKQRGLFRAGTRIRPGI